MLTCKASAKALQGCSQALARAVARGVWQVVLDRHTPLEWPRSARRYNRRMVERSDTHWLSIDDLKLSAGYPVPGFFAGLIRLSVTVFW